MGEAFGSGSEAQLFQDQYVSDSPARHLIVTSLLLQLPVSYSLPWQGDSGQVFS